MGARSLVLKTTWTRRHESDCDMLENDKPGLQPSDVFWSLKPRPMAWAGMAAHLRCSSRTGYLHYSCSLGCSMRQVSQKAGTCATEAVRS